MSDDESILEEEYLIYAELCDNADPNIFKHAESSFSSFALDSDQPLLIIGGQAFVGTYKDTVGTAVFLEETPLGSEEQIDIGNEPSDPLFVNSPQKTLQYVAHTRKTLEMSRVLLIEKNKQGTKNHEEEKELEQGSVELDDKVQNENMEDNQQEDEEATESVDIVNIVTNEDESFIGLDVVKRESEGITFLESNSSLMMDERQVVLDIEQMKITNDSNNLII